MLRRAVLLASLGAAVVLAGCASMQPPQGIAAVSPFDLARYEGRWYELARLYHSFERGMMDVSATYQRQSDGSVRVVNRGFDVAKNQWRQAVGKALFTGDANTASLKVSFFGPFYGGYNVIALDREYRHALVCGPDRDYLWILSRTPTISSEMKQQMLDVATRQGFDVSKLIWVKQPH